MQSWIVLAVAIACEVAGTIFMKLSDRRWLKCWPSFLSTLSQSASMYSGVWQR